MNSSELDETSQQFLIQLFVQTGGDSSTQVSMYDVGEGLGLDRDTSSRVAETLIGLQLAEIRTLSGGIGISIEGANEVKHLTGGGSYTDGSPGKLTDEPVWIPSAVRALSRPPWRLKARPANWVWIMTAYRN